MKPAVRLALWTWCLASGALAATYTVGFEKTVTIAVPRATAAYAVDPEFAEASADQGIVTVRGKSPGTTHVVVVTPEGVQTVEITVPMPPPFHPKGWVTPRPEGTSNESGYVETRYSSLPQQLNNVIDFARQSADLSTHFHLATTNFFPSPNNPYDSYNQSSVALTSLFYEIKTSRRKVTLVDQLLDESPLTVSNATVRGLHWQEGEWFAHAGYTSPATFLNLFLPVRREGVFGFGYHYRLSEHATLTPSVYEFTMSGANHTGKAGPVASLLYTYRPSDGFRVAVEVGASRGAGGSFDLRYKRPGEILRARLRYTPPQFASLSISNFRGFYSDASWTRQWTTRLGSDIQFTGNRFNLPNFNELAVNGQAQLRYRMTRQWTLFGGATYSEFKVALPGQPALRGVYYPAGVSFNSRSFGSTFQHQWSTSTGENAGGHQWLFSMRTGWRQLRFSGYGERETQAPTLSFILNQAQGLGPLLTELGLTAVTPGQISSFLTDNAALINLLYLRNVTVNVTPVREQASGSVAWQGRGKQPQVSYEFLYNNDQTITSSVQVAIHRVTATQRLGVSNDLSVTWAQYRTKTPREPSLVNPLYSLALQHHFVTVPGFLVLKRHGAIHGKVFEDPDGQGTYTSAMRGMGGVEVTLDQQRRTRTAADGTFRFAGVPEGKHQVQAILPSATPYYFTTPEQVDAEIEAEVYFGLAASLSSLAVEVVSDSHLFVAGVSIEIRGGGRRFTSMTGGDGKALIPRLPEGAYDVSIDPESLPPGYSIDTPAVVPVSTGPSSPGRAMLRVLAARGVAGRVLIYDGTLGRYVPVPGVEVLLEKLSLRKVTDREGRYLFRDLPAGTFLVSAKFQNQMFNQMVKIPDEPSQQGDINFIVGHR